MNYMKKLTCKYKNLPLEIRASFWFLIASFFQKGISAVTTPIFTRLMSTEQYGQYEIFRSWFEIISVFVSLNISAGFYNRGVVKYDKTRNVFTSSMLGLSTALVGVWTIIYLLFRDFWNQLLSLTTVQVLAMFAIILATSAFQFWSMEKRIDLNYKNLLILTAVVSFLKPTVGIVLVCFSEDKATARILGLAFVEVVFYSFCYISLMKQGKKFFIAEHWKKALVFTIPLIPHYLSTSILNGADKIMIERMVGASESGIYSLAYTISNIMTLFTLALNQTLDPWLYKQIKNKNLPAMGKVAYTSFTFVAVISLGLIALAPEIITLFAPAEYHEAVWIIPPVAMSAFFMFLFHFFSPFEFYYKKTAFIAIATSVGAVTNIILNYIFIKIFGYLAAGYTTLICFILYAVSHYIFMLHICKKEHNGEKPYNVKILLLISVSLIILGFLLTLTYKLPVVRYSIVAVSVIAAIIFRKKIMKMLNTIIATRKSAKDA